MTLAVFGYSILLLIFVLSFLRWLVPILNERVASNERVLAIIGHNDKKKGLTPEEIVKSVKTPINKKDLPTGFAKMVGKIMGGSEKVKSSSKR